MLRSLIVRFQADSSHSEPDGVLCIEHVLEMYLDSESRWGSHIQTNAACLDFTHLEFHRPAMAPDPFLSTCLLMGCVLPDASDSRSCRKRKRARNAQVEKPGPRSFSEMLDWPSQMRRDICRAPGMLEVVQAKLSKPLVLTTHYSGLGTAELALFMVEAGIRGDSDGAFTNVYLYSACESDPVARKMLMTHAGEDFRPDHVFGDILSRVPMDQLAVLKEVEAGCLASAEGVMKDPSLSSPDKTQLKDKYGQRMLTQFIEILSQCQFAERDFCHVHNQLCPLRPGMAVRGGAEHGDVAGTTCVAWSSMRSSDSTTGKWLHKSTLPCLVWLFWIKTTSPSWYLHECVTRFDVEFLMQELLQYMTVSFVFSPHQLGLPVNRHRRYTFGINMLTHTLASWLEPFLSEDETLDELARQPWLRQPVERQCHLRVALEADLLGIFLQLFSKDRVCECNIFLQAPHAMLEKYIDTLSRASNGIAAAARGSSTSLDMTALLPGALFQRLVGYRRLIREIRTTERWFVMDLGQTAGYAKNVSHSVPALLVKSQLCMLEASGAGSSSGSGDCELLSSSTRLVLPLEHFGIQGFPLVLRDDVSTKWSNFFPWDVNWLVEAHTLMRRFGS